jgi:hypothetical protein
MSEGQSNVIIVNEGKQDLVKSKKRVADHGEVFTPEWMVEDMLDLVKHESERIDSRFLEPACGSGNFLVAVLNRKLHTVDAKYGKNDFEKHHHALLALMCIYGIELLADNTVECRENLLNVFSTTLKINSDTDLYKAASKVLDVNILQGDALSMTNPAGEPLVFPEWAYLTKGKFQRRDFRFDSLTQRSSVEGTLWENFEEHEIFTPIKTYPPMSIEELGN